MSRVEEFKRTRHTRIKVTMTFLLFFIIIVLGITVSDYSINSLMNDEKSVSVISTKWISDTCFQISFMDWNLPINMKYVLNDYGRFKEYVRHLRK